MALTVARAVVFVIVRAWETVHARTNQRTHTHTVTDLDVFDVLSNL